MSATTSARRWLRRAAQALAGLAMGLGLGEIAFHLRDHGAFPHLNVYVPDARLGVRLRPGASQRLSAGRNPITSVRIDAEGLRGADLPPPGEGEILVVGDSQVFGLGVEEGETASADLARILGVTVIDAGVPTYGPPEYDALLEERLSRRPARTVIYVVNLANDLFEASHPNPERHVVWDGWAVRRETAPETMRHFPGREILFNRSHLVYALRSFLYARGPSLDERGFASEGSALDLVRAASRAGDDHAEAARETEEKRAARRAEIVDTAAKERDAETRLEEAALDTFDLRGREDGIAYKASRDNLGDIVIRKTSYIEGSRGQFATANLLFHGAEIRRRMEARIREFTDAAAAHEVDPGAPIRFPVYGPNMDLAEQAKKGRAHPLVRSLEERDALKERLDALKKTPAEIVRAWSPLTPLLRRAKATCDAHGARLLVVALPMDVMVSPAEWAKYGVPTAVDMAPTRILVEDVVASAEALGAAGLDATPALAAAEPGAFLDGDLHMTPKGHRALAEAIAGRLRRDQASR